MDPFKEKHFVFLISGGRTGTRFFGRLLGQAFEHAFSSHEPDVFTPRKGYDTWKKLRQFGVYHLIIGKFLGRTGIRNLSQNYVAGRLDIDGLVRRLRRHREAYYAGITSELIIESYSGWYGCIDGIRELYDKYRIVIIARDPRTWVTSVMNWDAIFGERDWVTKLGRRRLDPGMAGDREFEGRWKSMSRFEKVCWTYKGIYEIALRQSTGDGNCMVTRYEDLFTGTDRRRHIGETLAFMGNFPDRTFDFDPDVIQDAGRIHRSEKHAFPSYEDWTPGQKEQLNAICGDIARKLGYDLDAAV